MCRVTSSLRYRGWPKTLDAYGPPVLVEAPSAETKSFMESMGYTAYAYDQSDDRFVAVTGPVTNVMFVRGLPAAAR